MRVTEAQSAAPQHTPQLRTAEHRDIDGIRELIADSVRGLSRGFYTEEQCESALRHVFGVDTTLIDDGTYFIIEDGSGLLAAGGWSRREHLYGGDQTKGDVDPVLDPATSAARIRAFFVASRAARRGLGRRLFDECVTAAKKAGFSRLALAATMPGEPLYAALGFRVLSRYEITLPDGVRLPLAEMEMDIAR